MISSRRTVHTDATLADFLRADFERMDGALLARCMKIDGSSLYLSGATGFFGKNLLALLKFLHDRGASFEVTGLSRDPAAFLAENAWCKDLSWLCLRKGDVTDPWPGDGTYDLLIHAATDTHAAAHLDKLKMFRGIVDGTTQALEFAARHGVRRLMLAGSGAEYGVIPEAFESGVPESARLACEPASMTSAYGEGKRVSELLGAIYSERHGFTMVNSRCFAFLGPGLSMDGHYAIGNFIRDAIAGRPIRLSSTGSSVRSYLYGADLAIWLLVLVLEVEQNTTVNVGSDRAIRIIDLATLVRDSIDPGLSVETGAVADSSERKWYFPDITLARSLGLGVWTDLALAIERAALWQRLHTGAVGHES